MRRNMTVRAILLGCGIVSSVLYVAGDILLSLRYPGYSYTNQTISELGAVGAPTRPLGLVLVAIPYNVLVAAFAVGVWAIAGSAGPKRAVRITAAMLVGWVATGMAVTLFFPMAPRGTEATLRNVMHIPGTAVQLLFGLVAMGFAATFLGKRFRYYTYGTIATFLVFGVLTSLQAGAVATNQPTPWMGLEERINVYATMLWLAVLAIALLRALVRIQAPSAPVQLGQPTVSVVTAQPMQRVPAAVTSAITSTFTSLTSLSEGVRHRLLDWRARRSGA